MDSFTATIEVPKLGELLVGSASRTHDRIAKQAVHDVLDIHWSRRIPGHFQRPAHGKYKYAERSKRYRFRKQKKYGSSIDLVMSGRTRDLMTSQRRIVIRGTAAGGTLTGRLILRFPFPGGSQRFRKTGTRQAVTIQQMAREIEAFTPEEITQINAEVRERYTFYVKTATGPRQRVTV